MPRSLKLLLLLLPLAAALFIFVDTPLHEPSGEELSGVVVPEPLPDWSFAEFWNGQLQPKLEGWFEQQLTMKPAMVRTDNTINLMAFGEISAHTGIPIIVGNEDTLFEMNYVNNANAVSDIKGDPPPKSAYSVEESSRLMGQASRAFRALGIDFMLVLYPSKGWLWHDRLPRRYLLPGGMKRAQAGYQYLLNSLQSEGVPVIDGVDEFTKLAQTRPDLPLYARGGTHWTHPAACQVAARVVEHLSRSGNARLRCELGPVSPAEEVDRDLADLINVWDNERFIDSLPASKASLSQRLHGGRRAALFIGTSFSHQLVYTLKNARVIGNVKQLFYYRHKDSPHMNWNSLLRGRKLVIFEQWQWSFLTANLSEFLDDLQLYDPRFAAAMAAAK